MGITDDVLAKYGIEKGTGKSILASKKVSDKETKEKVKMEKKVISEEKKRNNLFIGKVKEMDGDYGPWQSIILDNPNPESDFHRFEIILNDKETGKSYRLKSLAYAGVGAKSKEHGFVKSIKVDVTNKWQVEEL